MYSLNRQTDPRPFLRKSQVPIRQSGNCHKTLDKFEFML